jgi:Arc/MetJ-type ribon-helix-helix transcriptional regulator
MAYGFPPELQQLVHQELASGSYSSEDDLLLDAVRLLHQRQEALRDFKVRLQQRLDRIDHGQGIELEDESALQTFFDDIQTRGRQRCEAGRVAP